MGFLHYFLGHRSWRIQPTDIVLDLGSGGDPIFRANILVDKYITTDFQRSSGFIGDRPTICADGACLPLRSKSIDFIYCSHVIEHIPIPEPFLLELQRVGKRGIIEAPHGDYEKLHPRELHLWYVYNSSGILKLIQKATWNEYEDISRMYEQIRKSFRDYYRFVSSNWKILNTIFIWEDKITYEIQYSANTNRNNFRRITQEGNYPEDYKARIYFRNRLKSFFSDL